MLLEPITAMSSSTLRCLECSRDRRLVEVDLHSRPQQLLVVGALRVVDEELVANLRGDQRHIDAALRRRGDRRHQRVIRHKVGIGDGELMVGGVR